MKTTPNLLIRSRLRQALWMPAVWTAVAGLGLLFAVGIWWPPADSGAQIRLWVESLAIIALTTALVRLRSRHSPRAIACALDAAMVTHNRLEAASELAHRHDALAVAQRTDTTAALATRRAPAPWAWGAGLALLALLASAHFISISISGYHVVAAWRSAAQAKSAQAKATAKTAAKTAQAKPVNIPPPPATLAWISPTPETTATPIEEVPLSAEADSVTGLKSVSLVVTVNGEARPEVPLPADVAAGKQPIALSIYLDELNVQPYDMVTYYLRADRIVPPGNTPDAPWPVVTSTLQFLQVRPLRDDTKLDTSVAMDPPPDNPVAPKPAPSAAGDPDDLLKFVKLLKVLQIKITRDTFALANDTPPHTDPSWPGLNQSVGSAQTALSDRTDRALNLAYGTNAPTEIVDLITKARDQMASAATSLGKPDPAAASPDQGRALANLTAVEKFFTKALQQKKGTSKSTAQDPPDPFKVNQPFKLPPREQTAAGQLAQLARQQAELADQIAGSCSNPGDGSGSSSGSGPSASTESKPSSSAAAGSSPSPNPAGNPSANPASTVASSPSPKPAAGLLPGSSLAAKLNLVTPPPVDMTKQQQKLADDIDALAKARTLPADVTPALEAAAKASRESLDQLAASNPTAAIEPASRAAAELRGAITQLDTASKADTTALLAEAQKALNQSASNIAGAKPGDNTSVATDAAARTADAVTALRKAALQQQATGSAAAADQLAKLANSITDSKVQDDLKKLAQAGDTATDANRQMVAQKLTSLAQNAADGQVAIGNRDAIAAQALAALRRDRLNLTRADHAGPEALQGLHDDVLDQAELANSNYQDSNSAKRTDNPMEGPIAMLTPPPPEDDRQHDPFMRMMGSQIDALIKMLSTEDASARPQVLITGQASEAPPAYRPAVADYFESLAHEPAPKPAPAQP